MASSLFKSAKDKGTDNKKKSAKQEKTRVTIAQPGYYEKVKRLAEIRENEKSMKAEAELLEQEIKEVGREEWAKIYEENGVNPESIMIESKKNNDTAQFMLLMSDKYITIDGERADYLTEKYGEEIVTENDTYSFDKTMVEKYGEVISNLILSSDEIAEADKEKIIKAEVTYSVAKGTINKLKIYADKTGNNVIDLIEEVKPVTSMKNVEYIQGVATR